MKKLLIRYQVPSCILFITITLSGFIIFCLSSQDPETRNTLLIAVFGFGLGLFQFSVSEINTNVRRDLELKQQRYSELKKIADSISERLNIEFLNSEISFNALMGHLMNLINDLFLTVDGDKIVFPHLKETSSYRNLKKLTHEISKATDDAWKKLQDIPKEDVDSILKIKKCWRDRLSDGLLRDFNKGKIALLQEIANDMA